MAAIYESMVVLSDESSGRMLDAVEKLAASERWRVRERTDRKIVCVVPADMWCSWGERVSVVAEPHSLRVISQCSLPLQVFDWGKNRRNVETVRDCLLQAMSASA